MSPAPERSLTPPAAFSRPLLRTYHSRLSGEFPYAAGVATASDPTAGEAYVQVEDYGTSVVVTVDDPALACHRQTLTNLTSDQIDELRAQRAV